MVSNEVFVGAGAMATLVPECDIFLDERKLIEELQDIKLTSDDFQNVTDNNINTLLHDSEEEEEEDDYCTDENFGMTGIGN